MLHVCPPADSVDGLGAERRQGWETGELPPPSPAGNWGGCGEERGFWPAWDTKMDELMEEERLVAPCGCPFGGLAVAYSLPGTIRWVGRNLLWGETGGWKRNARFSRLPILFSSSRSPPAAAGREEQPLPDQGSLWPSDAAAPEQRLPAPLPPPPVRAQPRAHADSVSAAGMELRWALTDTPPSPASALRSDTPFPAPPSIPTIPGSSFTPPGLLCGHRCSLPRGRQRWLGAERGGFCVYIW